MVDVLGCMLSVDVHAANIHDTKSGIFTAKEAYTSYPSIQKFCADAGYRGTFVSDVKERLGLGVDISEKIKPHLSFSSFTSLSFLILYFVLTGPSNIFIFFLFLIKNGDSCGNRTRVTSVRGWCLDRLTNEPGTPSGVRTLDTLIKSQVLYQLS